MQRSVVKPDASLADHSSTPEKPAGDLKRAAFKAQLKEKRAALKAQLKVLRSQKTQVLSCLSEGQKSEDEAETEAGYGAASSQRNIMARGQITEAIVHNQAVQCHATATASMQDVKTHDPGAADQARLLVTNAAMSDTEDTTHVQAAQELPSSGMKLTFEVKDKELRRKIKHDIGKTLNAEAVSQAKVRDILAYDGPFHTPPVTWYHTTSSTNENTLGSTWNNAEMQNTAVAYMPGMMTDHGTATSTVDVALQLAYLHRYLESVEHAGTSIPTSAAGL
jgi:hypothetical protein